jgi:hypothetical protein
MKILRKEDISYQVIYVEQQGQITAYKKMPGDKWEIYRSNSWKPFTDESTIKKIESLLNG